MRYDGGRSASIYMTQSPTEQMAARVSTQPCEYCARLFMEDDNQCAGCGAPRKRQGLRAVITAGRTLTSREMERIVAAWEEASRGGHVLVLEDGIQIDRIETTCFGDRRRSFIDAMAGEPV